MILVWDGTIKVGFLPLFLKQIMKLFLTNFIFNGFSVSCLYKFIYSYLSSTFCFNCLTLTNFFIDYLTTYVVFLLKRHLMIFSCQSTVVSHEDDVNTAVKVHLLQAVHHLTNNVVDFPQRIVQLSKGGWKHASQSLWSCRVAANLSMSIAFSSCTNTVTPTSLLSGPRRWPKVSGCSEWIA